MPRSGPAAFFWPDRTRGWRVFAVRAGLKAEHEPRPDQSLPGGSGGSPGRFSRVRTARLGPAPPGPPPRRLRRKARGSHRHRRAEPRGSSLKEEEERKRGQQAPCARTGGPKNRRAQEPTSPRTGEPENRRARAVACPAPWPLPRYAVGDRPFFSAAAPAAGALWAASALAARIRTDEDAPKTML